MASPEGHTIAPNAQAAFTELFIALCQLPEPSPVLSFEVLDMNVKFKFTGRTILLISQLSSFMTLSVMLHMAHGSIYVYTLCTTNYSSIWECVIIRMLPCTII